MLFTEMAAIYSEYYMKPIKMRGHNAEHLILSQVIHTVTSCFVEANKAK
jgi:hypothetical protein